MPKPKKGESKQDYLKRCTGDLVKNEGKESDEAYAICNSYWDDANSQRATLSLQAPLELQKSEKPEASPGFLITAYTGQVIDRGWWGKLVIDTAGIKTKTKMPILREHFRDRVVGMSSRTWKEGQNLFIRGEYSGITKDGKEVRELAEEGFPWQASIGVWPKKVKVLDSDKESFIVNGKEVMGPIEIWTQSEVREVSFVALGADDETAAINFSEGERVKVQLERGQAPENKEEEPMRITLAQLETEAPELLRDIREGARAEGQDSGMQAERARVTEILDADGDRETSLKAIKEGTSAEQTFKLLYQAEKTKSAEALKSMEAAAPESMGQAPAKPAPIGADDPDAKLSKLSMERAKEKGISLDAAMMEISNENPDLVAKWNPAAQIH